MVPVECRDAAGAVAPPSVPQAPVRLQGDGVVGGPLVKGAAVPTRAGAPDVEPSTRLSVQTVPSDRPCPAVRDDDGDTSLVPAGVGHAQTPSTNACADEVIAVGVRTRVRVPVPPTGVLRTVTGPTLIPRTEGA